MQVGQRAGVGVFVNSCRDCAKCKRKTEQYCKKMVFTYNAVDYDGVTAQGGYSTHITINEDYAVRACGGRAGPCAVLGVKYWPAQQQSAAPNIW